MLIYYDLFAVYKLKMYIFLPDSICWVLIEFISTLPSKRFLGELER